VDAANEIDGPLPFIWVYSGVAYWVRESSRRGSEHPDLWARLVDGLDRSSAFQTWWQPAGRPALWLNPNYADAAWHAWVETLPATEQRAWQSPVLRVSRARDELRVTGTFAYEPVLAASTAAELEGLVRADLHVLLARVGQSAKLGPHPDVP
jgi:hypothetical protein